MSSTINPAAIRFDFCACRIGTRRRSPGTVSSVVVPVLGSYTCALYISLRYHLLQPKYLIRRIKELRK